MAEFSKEYDEITGHGWNDFSIMDIFNSLEPGYMETGFICEGFGIQGVRKTFEGECEIALSFQMAIQYYGVWTDPIPDGYNEDDICWVDYNYFIIEFKDKFE